MSGTRFVDKQVERFDLGEGDWVDLVTRLPYIDRAKIEERLLGAAVAKAQPPTSGPAPEKLGDGSQEPVEEVEIALAAANLELLKRTIIKWGGPGFTLENGAVAPINESTISALDETAEKILNELQRRMVKPAKGFTRPPSQPTPMTGTAANTEGDSKN